MKTRLSMNPFEETLVNVYDLETKKIIFTGSEAKAAKFLGIKPGHISSYVKRKTKIKNKRYTIRHASTKQV